MQSMQQAGQIECDSQLGAVFQAKQVKLSSLSQRISPHLRPVEPLSLRYTVRLGPSPSPSTKLYALGLACLPFCLFGRLDSDRLSVHLVYLYILLFVPAGSVSEVDCRASELQQDGQRNNTGLFMH